MFIKNLKKEYSSFKNRKSQEEWEKEATQIAQKLKNWNNKHKSNANNSYGRKYTKNQNTPEIKEYKRRLKLN